MRALSLSMKFKAALLPATLIMLAPACAGQQPQHDNPMCPFLPWTAETPGHPHPQSRPTGATVSITQEAGVTVARINTAQGCFAESNPFQDPPGTNLLPTIFTNAFDGSGNEMPNTLPSTPDIPYNLHDGVPVVSKINPVSPTDDLLEIFERVESTIRKAKTGRLSEREIEAIGENLHRGVAIMEGDLIPDRNYSGFPLLHYAGPEKVRKVIPIKDASGNVIGGNVDIHEVWYDNHIESDVAFIDPTAVENVPWTMTWTVDVLSRGNDDFSPFVTYIDDPALGLPPKPHIAMDQTFYNMEEGTRTIFKIKMAPGKYYNLVYAWGWRAHPPRVQVIENATKRIPPNPQGTTLVDLEVEVFGQHPSADKPAAIAHIGDLSPAKRMWAAFRSGRAALGKKDYRGVADEIKNAREAFYDWRDRTKLPRGVRVDRNSDLTLLYVNNTIYGEFREGFSGEFPPWTLRGTTLKVTLINGDYFTHGYQNMDFGGARGWENQFQSSVATGGSGPWFTFGRLHWFPNIPGSLPDGTPFLVKVPPAAHVPGGDDTLGRYKVEIIYNFEPSRRLRFYQFDPMHHDVAIFSVH